MTRDQLDGFRIFKSDRDSRVKGTMLTADDLRGPTGDALIEAILAADGEEKVYEIEGRHYAVFGPRTPDTAA
jgi:hypothetical protein